MKLRTNLSLDARAVAAGKRAARLRGEKSLSALVEKHLLSLAAEPENDDHFSPHHGKTIARPGDRRYEFLRRKHA
jgi:hypothetical protein